MNYVLTLHTDRVPYNNPIFSLMLDLDALFHYPLNQHLLYLSSHLLPLLYIRFRSKISSINLNILYRFSMLITNKIILFCIYIPNISILILLNPKTTPHDFKSESKPPKTPSFRQNSITKNTICIKYHTIFPLNKSYFYFFIQYL